MKSGRILLFLAIISCSLSTNTNAQELLSEREQIQADAKFCKKVVQFLRYETNKNSISFCMGFYQANAEYDEGQLQFEKVIILHKRILELEPTNYGVRLSLASLVISQWIHWLNYPEAFPTAESKHLDAYRILLEGLLVYNKQDFRFHLDAASLLQDMSRHNSYFYSQAEKTLLKALPLAKTTLEKKWTYLFLARWAVLEDEHDKAAQYYKELLVIAPDNDTARDYLDGIRPLLTQAQL